MLAAVIASTVSAQGGWRQWDVHLRDGSRVEANPLGAPDDAHIAVSVGGLEGHDATIPRSRIDYIAAQTTVGPNREALSGVKLPPLPKGKVCEDVIVRRDGRKTRGRVTLTRVVYSEGVVKQGGVDIELSEIAYIKFGRQCARPKADPSLPSRSLRSARTARSG